MVELPEVAFLIATQSKDLQGELKALLPEADVESSDNFVGGTEIAIFANLALDTLKSILGFLAKKQTNIKSAKLKIGTSSIEITGYSPDQAKQLLESPAIQEAIAKYRP